MLNAAEAEASCPLHASWFGLMKTTLERLVVQVHMVHSAKNVLYICGRPQRVAAARGGGVGEAGRRTGRQAGQEVGLVGLVVVVVMVVVFAVTVMVLVLVPLCYCCCCCFW